MTQAFAPGLLAQRGVTVRRLRELPVKGEILAKQGVRVASTDLVARALLPGDLHILRIPEKLGIEPFEVMRSLAIKEGDTVAEGQLLCEHAGLFGLLKSRFHSPIAGMVDFITAQTGHVGIRVAPREIALNGYLSGTVVEVEPEKSLTIEATASLVQGIFGVGGERQGRLMLLAVPPQKEILPSDIPDSCNGAILVGGARPRIETLRHAASRGAVALVTGSIDDRTLAEYLGFDLGVAITGDEKVPMTVILTEGFGNLPMSDRILETLRPHDGAAASVNGTTQVRAGAVRPEVVVCTEGPGINRSEEGLTLRVGARMRVIRIPYFGKFGTITALPPQLTRIETGAEARILRARLDGGEEVTVPRANIELV